MVYIYICIYEMCMYMNCICIFFCNGMHLFDVDQDCMPRRTLAHNHTARKFNMDSTQLTCSWRCGQEYLAQIHPIKMECDHVSCPSPKCCQMEVSNPWKVPTVLLHFSRMFCSKPSSYWGTPMYPLSPLAWVCRLFPSRLGWKSCPKNLDPLGPSHFYHWSCTRHGKRLQKTMERSTHAIHGKSSTIAINGLNPMI